MKDPENLKGFAPRYVDDEVGEKSVEENLLLVRPARRCPMLGVLAGL